MQNTIAVLTLIGVIGIVNEPFRAQQIPAVVVRDPVVDKRFPPGLSVLTIRSHRVDMDAFLYLAAGVHPHKTVALLHGLPGYEINGDLAQSIRRAETGSTTPCVPNLSRRCRSKRAVAPNPP